MISLITVAWHGYLAQQIVQVFITIKKPLPSLHQHRINIITVKHVHTKPYIFVRFNIHSHANMNCQKRTWIVEDAAMTIIELVRRIHILHAAGECESGVRTSHVDGACWREWIRCGGGGASARRRLGATTATAGVSSNWQKCSARWSGSIALCRTAEPLSGGSCSVAAGLNASNLWRKTRRW